MRIDLRESVGWSLAAFLFILPESEALAHVLFASTVGLAFLSGLRSRRFDAVDASLIGFALIPVVAHFTSDLTPPAPLRGSTHWMELAAMTVVVRRVHLREEQTRRCVRAAVLGTLLSLVLGLLWHREHAWVSLRSVGFINQVALYLDLILVVALHGAINERGLWRGFMIGAASLFCIGVWLSDSITAIAVLAPLFLLALQIVMSSSWRRHASVVLVTTLVAAAVAICLSPKVRIPLQSGTITLRSFLSNRDRLLRSAVTVFPRNPILGTGARSFEQATSEDRIRSVLSIRGESFDPDRYQLHAVAGQGAKGERHGHGLFTNTIVERGLAGLACIAVLLWSWSWKLARLGPSVRTAWLGGLAYVLVGGLGNTTLMVEHGWLLLTFWALLEGSSQEPVSSPSNLESTGPLS